MVQFVGKCFIRVNEAANSLLSSFKGKVVSSLCCFPCLDRNRIFPDLSLSLIFFLLLQINSFAAHFGAFS